MQAYYARLADADQPRRGDLDGSGNLSEKGLAAFAKYFLETCLDQVTFMAELLQLKDLRPRVRAYLKLLAETESDIRTEAEPALYHVFLAGSVKRGDAEEGTPGLGHAERPRERRPAAGRARLLFPESLSGGGGLNREARSSRCRARNC